MLRTKPMPNKKDGTELLVLLNIASGFAPDFNLKTAQEIKSVPEVLTNLRKKKFIDKNLKLTEKGLESAGLILTLTCEHFTDGRKPCKRCTRKTCAVCKYCRACSKEKA